IHSTSSLIFTLSLHDALPILPFQNSRAISTTTPAAAKFIFPSKVPRRLKCSPFALKTTARASLIWIRYSPVITTRPREWVKDWRSEEHTSELQSRENLVCRLL